MKIELIELQRKYYIPLYLIFISLLLLSSRDFEAAQSSPITLSNIHRILSILLEITMIIYYFMKREYILKPPKSLLFYGLFIFIGLLSTLIYSQNFLYDMWKLTELLSLFLLGIYIWDVSNGDIRIILSFYNKVILFIKILLLSIVLSVIIDPANAIQYLQFGEIAVLPFRIQGTIIIINALSVGTLAAIILFHYIIEVFYINKFKLLSKNTFWILISIILLITSQSRTSIFGVLLSLTIYYLFINKMNYYKQFFTIVLGSIFIINFLPYFTSFIQRGNSSEVIGSLSGRTEWWSFAWEKFLNGNIVEQLIGFGFASAERKTANDSSNNVMNTLDSTYFSSLMSTGAIGTSILISLVIFLIYVFFKKARKDKMNFFYIQIFGFMIILALKTFTTGTINILTYYSLFFIILILLATGKNYTKDKF